MAYLLNSIQIFIQQYEVPIADILVGPSRQRRYLHKEKSYCFLSNVTLLKYLYKILKWTFSFRLSLKSQRTGVLHSGGDSFLLT